MLRQHGKHANHKNCDNADNEHRHWWRNPTVQQGRVGSEQQPYQ
jgi:hypothetical protein